MNFETVFNAISGVIDPYLVTIILICLKETRKRVKNIPVLKNISFNFKNNELYISMQKCQLFYHKAPTYIFFRHNTTMFFFCEFISISRVISSLVRSPSPVFLANQHSIFGLSGYLMCFVVFCCIWAEDLK